MSPNQAHTWWQTAVFYQIYPRSFKEYPGDRMLVGEDDDVAYHGAGDDELQPVRVLFSSAERNQTGGQLVLAPFEVYIAEVEGGQAA